MVGDVGRLSTLLLVLILISSNSLYAESCLPSDKVDEVFNGQILPLRNSVITNLTDLGNALSNCELLMAQFYNCKRDNGNYLNESYTSLARNTYTTCRDSFLKSAIFLGDKGDYGLAASMLVYSKEFINGTNAGYLAGLTEEEYNRDYDQIQILYEQNIRYKIAELEKELNESNYSNCTAAREKAGRGEQLLVLNSSIPKHGLLTICNDAPDDVNKSYNYYVQCMEICSKSQQTQWNYFECFEKRITIMEDYNCILNLSIYEKANLYELAGRNFSTVQGNLSGEYFDQAARIWGGIGYNIHRIPEKDLTDEDFVNASIAIQNSYMMYYYANEKIEMQEQMNEWLSILNAFARRLATGIESFTLIIVFICSIWFLVIEQLWPGAPIRRVVEKLADGDNSIKILTPIGIVLSIAFTVSFSGASSQIDKIPTITKPDYILNDAANWTYFTPFLSLSVKLALLSAFLFLVVWLFNREKNAKSLWIQFPALLGFYFFLSSALTFVSATFNKPVLIYQLSWFLLFVILFIGPNQIVGWCSIILTKINEKIKNIQKNKTVSVTLSGESSTRGTVAARVTSRRRGRPSAQLGPRKSRGAPSRLTQRGHKTRDKKRTKRRNSKGKR